MYKVAAHQQRKRKQKICVYVTTYTQDAEYCVIGSAVRKIIIISVQDRSRSPMNVFDS